MRLKLYRAADIAEAMAQVRAELGPEALILSSRRVAGGVEVTAALEQDPPAAPPAAPPLPRPPDPPPQARRRPIRCAPPSPGTACRPDWRAGWQAGPLPFALATALRFDQLPLRPAAPPLLVVGPPGAGKTLTVARLATRLVMAGIAPLVVTADGKPRRRRRAARRLHPPARPATAGGQRPGGPRPRARPPRQDGAPVLIDTPGHRPVRPAAARGDRRRWPPPPAPSWRWCCRPGSMSARPTDLAGAYAACGARLLAATRLDLRAAHRRGAGRRRRRARAGGGRDRPGRRRRPRADDPRPARHPADAGPRTSRRPHRSAPDMTAATTIATADRSPPAPAASWRSPPARAASAKPGSPSRWRMPWPAPASGCCCSTATSALPMSISSSA